MRCRLSLCASFLAATVGLCVAEGTGVSISVSERPAEIGAKCWFNAQPVRLYESPRLILLEFYSVSSRESRRLARPLQALHEAFRNKGLLIVGLTPDSCDDALRFIRRKAIDFKVGAESRSVKKYGVEDFPTVVLISAADQRVLGRWSGRDVPIQTIVQVIREHLDPKSGEESESPGLSPEQWTLLQESVGDARRELGAITDEVLGNASDIHVENILPLDRFYEDHLPDDPTLDDDAARTATAARGMLLGSDRDVGYGRLLASGRLSDDARKEVRDRMLQIAGSDPAVDVRITAVHALRLLGEPGDPLILDTLGNMRDKEVEPLARASIDHALRELDSATRKEALSEHKVRPVALRIRQMLNESSDPAATQWAEAYAYGQTTDARSIEQLFTDYESFNDPPDDEIGLQNATLKRDAAFREIQKRLRHEDVNDPDNILEQLRNALSSEPDEWIRRGIVDSLRQIAKLEGRGLRDKTLSVLENRLADEPDGYVRARIEAYLNELKGG